MKAIITTTMMLMAISIGTLEASAQSARRGTPDSKQRKTSATSVNKANSRTAQYNGSRTSAQQNPKQRIVQQTQTRKVSDRSSVQRSTQQRAVQQSPGKKVPERSKTITTNRNNPKSDYRSAARTEQYGKTHKDPRQATQSGKRTQPKKVVTTVNNRSAGYSTGHTKYYPKKRVKVHVHPTTYNHHYRVMYYPAHRDIIWTNRMHRYYIGLYPGVHLRYHNGYRVQTISAFDARYNVGEVSRVYGRVYGTWYNRESDDLLLFFGGEYPRQEFTMIIPGNVARRYSWRPERYFLGQHIMATGFISSFEGSPEMIVKKRNQLEVF